MLVEKTKARTQTAARVTSTSERPSRKIAPSLEGFPERCRSGLPQLARRTIDYIVFRGLHRGVIDSLKFVDIKSPGRARLNDHQRSIRTLVESAKISFYFTPSRKSA